MNRRLSFGVYVQYVFINMITDAKGKIFDLGYVCNRILLEIAFFVFNSKAVMHRYSACMDI